MEECEALCNKLGILAKGQFKCLGPSTYIKSKYGKGFSFTIKCKRSADPSEDEVLMVEKHILNNIPNTILKGICFN